MSTFRALRVRNFRLYFAGQAVSLTGTWMQQVAQSWLLYRLTGSPFMLGVATFMTRAPVLLVSLPVGALTEHADRRKVIIAMQALALVQALGLAALVLLGKATPTVVIGFSLLLGMINAVDLPVRHAFVGDLVPAADLPSAVGMHSTVVNAARIVGPALAGMLVAAVGEGYCFLLNAASYLAVLIGLTRMTPLARSFAPLEAGRLAMQLREGFAYIAQERRVVLALVLVAVVSFCGTPYVTLMPAFAAEVLRGDASTLGWLMAATGVGAMVGAVTLAARKAGRNLLASSAAHAAIMGGALVAFSLSGSLASAVPALFGVGYGMILALTSANAFLQTHVRPEVRGRVMSMYTIAFVGTAPFGALLAGAVAERVATAWVLAASGLLTLGLSLYLASPFRSR